MLPNSRINSLRSSLAALTVVAVMLCGTRARADVVMPEPDDCPEGSKAGTCHGGPHCRAEPCVDDASCTNGKTCQQVKRCVEQINCSSRNPTPSYVDSLTGSCKGDGTCSEGTCKTIKLCLEPGGEATSRGCSCRVAAAPDGPWAVIAGLALVWMLRRRRD